MKLSNIISRKNRILLAELVRTDFKLRYQASTLGYLWSILSPLFLFAILYIVFDKFLGIGKGIEHFPVYLLLGIVLWRFFTEATNNGLKAIIQRGSLIRKINFPKYIIVVSGTVSSFINLLINLGVVLVFILINNVELTWSALLIFPLIIELYVFALSIAFLLSAMNVFFRDISYLWDIFLQAAFYATPILYPVAFILNKSELAAQIVLFNPVAQVIQDSRFALVTKNTDTLWSISNNAITQMVPFVIIVITLIAASLYFKKKSKLFAEFI